MANFTNTQTDGSNEAFLVAFDTNYINSDGTLGRTYNLNLGITYAQLAADPANALIAYQNAGKDLSLDSNWSTFKTLGAGETTQNIIYGIFAAGDMLGTKYQGYFSSGTMTQAPPVEANTTPPGSVTITWKGQIDAINVHAAEIARGNTTATTSTLVKSTDTANTGQVDSKLGYRQTFEGGTSEQDNFVSYGSSNDFYFNSTHLGTYVRRGKTYDAAIIAQSDIAKVGTFTLSGNTLKYVPASVVTPNIAPTLTNFTADVSAGLQNKQIAITFDSLKTKSDAKDADGSVTAFDITAVTTGSLKIGFDAASATAYNATTNHIVDATHVAYWTPANNAYGSLNAFTVEAKDNGGLVSTTPVQAKISVSNVITGKDQADTLNATATEGGANTIYGLAGNDKIIGGAGNDLIIGGAGNDSLTGGAGNDIFYSDTAANNTTNYDTITDFAPGTDDLQFSKAIFDKLGATAFVKNDQRFWSSTTGIAHDASDRLIYNTKSGVLSYDSDGTGPEKPVAIEVLGTSSTHPLLTATDIIGGFPTTNQNPTLTSFTNTVATINLDTQSDITFDALVANSDASDVDGSVAGFDIKSVTSGTLLIGADAATATAWDSNTNFTIDATHQAFWTPDLNATGTLNAFTAVALDNGGLESSTPVQATVTVNTVNQTPTLTSFTNTVASINENTQSDITFDALVANSDASDVDGSVAGFDIKSVTSGTLLIGADAATATAWDSNTNFTIDATHQAFWTPDLNASGVLNAFTAVAVDNAGLGSVTPIQATVAVTFVNYAPTFTNFAAPVATGNEDIQISITLDNLKAQGNEADNDGTVNGFVIKELSSGSLLIGSSLATATAWNASSNNSIDATHLAFWTPATNANGTLNAFTAVAKDDGGLESATPVQATVSVTEINDLPTGAVKITGTPTQNQILTASNTLADVDGLGTITYQWQANGVSILGANKPTYTLGQTEVGKTVTVKASYTDGHGHNESVLSSATSKVQVAISPGITFSNTANLTTTEAGGTAAFGVALKTAPHHDVVLTLTSNDATEGMFASTQTTTQTLTFTPTNWNQVQTVTLKGVDDKIVDGNVDYTISTKVTSDDLNYDGMRSGTGLAIANIHVTNNDDDQPDEIYGDDGGHAINDYLIGGNGASDIYGLLGRDELHGGNGDDRLYGGYGDDVLYGEADNDQLEGEQGDDKLYGGDGNDTLNGGTGNDSLTGGNGDDVLDGGTGKDSMDGGNGSDTYYVDNSGDVVSDSGTTGIDTVNIASYISSTFTYTLGAGIENAWLSPDARDADLTGNTSNNTLTGNSFDNQLAGGDGTDTLNGGAGNDTLTGGNGSDQLDGGAGVDNLLGGDGSDTLNGGTSNDSLNGGTGNDELIGGAGNDTINGGVGFDCADYSSSTSNLTINLKAGTAKGNDIGTDSLTAIEEACAGSGNDVITGSDNNNQLEGAAGNDTLNGGTGNDTLNGGTGNDSLVAGNGNDIVFGGAGLDILSGGIGADSFDFNAIAESAIGKSHDIIKDFTHSQADKIDLIGIDANSKVTGDQAFSYLGSKAFDGKAGEIHYISGVLSGDINGDKVADFEIAITLVGTTSLVVGDFVL